MIKVYNVSIYKHKEQLCAPLDALALLFTVDESNVKYRMTAHTYQKDTSNDQVNRPDVVSTYAELLKMHHKEPLSADVY